MKDGTTIIMKKEVKINKPIMVVGLPGIGSVGKLVAEHLKNEFEGVRFATLYSNHFPHKVVMLKSGGVRLVNNRFYLIKSKKKNGNDIVLLTGDDQAITPEGQYEVNMQIVNFFKEKLKGEFIYTIGGYTTGVPIQGAPKVYGNTTGKDVIEQFKGSQVIFGKSKGMIWGSAGLIIAFAKMKKMKGICLMGEVSYVDIDAAAAKSVMAALGSRLGLEIDTKALDKIITKTAKAVKDIEQQMMTYQTQQGMVPTPPDPHPSYIR